MSAPASPFLETGNGIARALSRSETDTRTRLPWVPSAIDYATLCHQGTCLIHAIGEVEVSLFLHKKAAAGGIGSRQPTQQHDEGKCLRGIDSIVKSATDDKRGRRVLFPSLLRENASATPFPASTPAIQRDVVYDGRPSGKARFGARSAPGKRCSNACSRFRE